jgi:hypothetical protein
MRSKCPTVILSLLAAAVPAGPGQVRQYLDIQDERSVALEHADRQRRHGLRHREHITANVIDPRRSPPGPRPATT